MSQRTQVTEMKVKTRTKHFVQSTAELTELPKRQNQFGVRVLQLDRLVRDLAVVGGLVLVLIAVRNSSAPEAQSVFGALQESVNMEWDESVGKLRFVNSILPEEIREVWSDSSAISVMAPVEGALLQTWSSQRPYLLIEAASEEIVAAADGEVMSIAHGMDEERIVRIRHDGFETIYGNLKECVAEVGDMLRAGQPVGTLLKGQPLTFEVRVDGRAIDPTPYYGRMGQ